MLQNDLTTTSQGVLAFYCYDKMSEINNLEEVKNS